MKKAPGKAVGARDVPLGLAALLLGGIIMGFSPVLVREAGVDAFASAFWRVFFALPALFLWACYERDDPNQKTSSSFAYLYAGLFFAGDLVFWHLAILNTTMANATFMVCLAPIWVALFSGYFLNEPLAKRTVVGLITCFAGLGLLVASSLQIEPARLVGDIYGLITSFFLGAYFLSMRFARQELKPGKLFFKSTFITGVVLLGIAMIAGNQMIPATSGQWVSLISLGLFTHAGGQGLVTLALGALSAVFSSLVIFIEAIAAAFFGWLFFGEEMAPLQWSGCILMLAGLWIAQPYRVAR